MSMLNEKTTFISAFGYLVYYVFLLKAENYEGLLHTILFRWSAINMLEYRLNYNCESATARGRL